MLFTICSFCIFVNAQNIIFMYILIELQSIGSYILTAFNKNSRCSIEAALKYFIIGSFSSTILSLGLSLIYGATGMVDIHEIGIFIKNAYLGDSEFVSYTLLLGVIFTTIGFLAKIYTVPFHFWVPDIYQGAPTSTTFFLSTVPFISYFYVFIKLYISIFSFVADFNDILSIFSILSMVLGLLGALVQTKIKKILAYSSVTTTGFILAGISSGDIYSISQSLLYLIVYILNITPIFIFILNYRFNNKESIDSITFLSGLYNQNK